MTIMARLMGDDAHGAAGEVPALPLLTLGFLGAQCIWSVEMAFGAPLLMHLGMPKSQLAVVFVAGPLSGLIVQPCIGLISDASTNAWGRRRPMLLTSCAICAPSILLLGFARPLAVLLTQVEESQRKLTLFLAVVSIFVIDFSVNAVTALDRALILDLVPANRQEIANAWAARLAGFGAIFGFYISQVDLTKLPPFAWFSAFSAGDPTEAQLRCVCLLAALLLCLTHTVTMRVAKEQSPSTIKSDVHLNSTTFLQGIASILLELQTTAMSLSQPMVHLFRTQIFLQLAWYPILFYSTTWVAQIAVKSTQMEDAVALRIGSSALLMQACLSIACTLTLPAALQRYARSQLNPTYDSLSLLWAVSTFVLAAALLSTSISSSMGSVFGAVLTIASTGFSSALGAWAPFTLLGILIRKDASEELGMRLPTIGAGTGGDSHDSRQSAVDMREEGRSLMRHREQDNSDDEDEHDDRALQNEIQDIQSHVMPKRGATILGLFNTSIVLPQFIITVLCTVLFAYLEKPDPVDAATGTSKHATFDTDSDAVGILMRLAGFSALIAAFLILRLSKQHASAFAQVSAR
jgi:solute carrier family 45 protein 1/2/4